ncbi:hypothetical protein DL96DRAFT_162846 [Flagelloscypha sp. PMI_526]|nr:hypothetical protein DL96DRAFT_162846 [Flagelloscypha sp. PMI_526]
MARAMLQAPSAKSGSILNYRHPRVLSTMHPFLRQRVTRPQSMHISFLGRLYLFRTIQSGPRISQTKETFPFEWWNIAISSMKVIGWSSIIFIPVAMVFKLPHPLLDSFRSRNMDLERNSRVLPRIRHLRPRARRNPDPNHPNLPDHPILLSPLPLVQLWLGQTGTAVTLSRDCHPGTPKIQIPELN